MFAAPFDQGKFAFSRPPAPVLDGIRSTLNTADMAVSARGTVIYVAGAGGIAGTEAVEPVWVSRSGAVIPLDTAWTVNILGAAVGSLGRKLAISPQGDRLALGILRPGAGSASDIWIKQLARAPFTLTKLTFESDNANPVWTRDGRSLVYTSGGLTAAGQVRRRSADGAGAVDTLLALARGINDVILTPDSSRYVLRMIGPPSRDIVAWKRGDTTFTPMMASPVFNEVGAALSPDGRWLAYASDESGKYEVFVRPYPDWAAGRWQVSQAGGQAPVWARSGREIFYQNGAGALIAAAVLPGATFTTGAHTRLFDASGFAGAAGALYYDVAPDDKRFVMLRRVVQPGTTQADRLVQITNWAAEVQAKLAGKAPQ